MVLYCDPRLYPWASPTSTGLVEPQRAPVEVEIGHRDTVHYRVLRPDGTRAYGYVSWPMRQLPNYPELIPQAEHFTAELGALIAKHGVRLWGDEEGEIGIEIDGNSVGSALLGTDGGVEFSPAVRDVPKTLTEGLGEYEAAIAKFEAKTGQAFPADVKERVINEHS